MLTKKITLERAGAIFQIMPAIVFLTSTVVGTTSASAAGYAGGGGTNNNAILNDSCDTVSTIKTWIFMVAYILAAIGLVVVAISAFLGRFKFSHLISLGGGLFIVAGADALIAFASSGGGSTTCSDVGPV
jgi:hypothetical protein